MKKCLLIPVLLILISMGAFAQTFSLGIGGGGLFDWSFNNGVEKKIGSDTYYEGLRNMSFGGFIFFDLTYVEIDAGFTYGLLTAVIDNPSVSDTEKAGNMLQASASILLKYPFDFGKVTFFPLLGANYNMVFVRKDKDDNKIYDSVTDSIKYFSQFGLLGGAGIDITLAASLFLRIEAMYHVRFADKTAKDDADTDPDAYTTLGMGPRVKIGIGCKF